MADYAMKEDLKQSDLERFEEKAFPRGKWPEMATGSVQGHILRSALRAKILDSGLSVSDVDSMASQEVAAAYEVVMAWYREATRKADPNTSG